MYNCKSVNYFFAGPFFESFYDLGLKKGGLCPESRVGHYLDLIIHYVNWEIFGTEKRWSVFRDGPLCEAVRYRVSTVHVHTHYKFNTIMINVSITYQYRPVYGAHNKPSEFYISLPTLSEMENAGFLRQGNSLIQGNFISQYEYI